MAFISFSVVLIIVYLFALVYLNKDNMARKKEISELESKLNDPELSTYIKDSLKKKLADIKNSKQTISTVSKWVTPVFVILFVLLLALNATSIVPTGYTGIKTTFGKVEDDVLSSGVNFIFPWQSVITMDNRTQKVQLDTQAFSSDIQQVDIKMSVNYSIDQETAQILYRTVGTNYYENIMYPRIQENTKAVFSQYTAESLVEKRNDLSDRVAKATAEDMKQYGITIVSVSIENIDFTDAFTDAVEAKQVAAQKKLTAETEQAQKTMEEEAQAKRAIIAENAKAEQAVIAAKADLEVVKIQAEASLYAGQKEAEMNQRIAESLTDGLIKYNYIKQWDGKLPTTMLSGETSMLLNIME